MPANRRKATPTLSSEKTPAGWGASDTDAANVM